MWSTSVLMNLQSYESPCGVYGGQSATVTGFLLELEITQRHVRLLKSHFLKRKKKPFHF
jgi:hypothetical protein